MYEPSKTKNPSILKEWESLDMKAEGIDNFVVYYLASADIPVSKKLDYGFCQKVTLDVKKLNPNSFIGLLHGITDTAAQNLPDVFRFWQERQKEGRIRGDPSKSAPRGSITRISR